MLGETELSKGQLKKGPQLHDVTTGIKLKDLGIDKHESYRYQKIASFSSPYLNYIYNLSYS